MLPSTPTPRTAGPLRAAGLLVLGLLLLHPATGDAQILGVPEGNDRFGDAVATGDFDGDGRADLAIDAPLEAEGALAGAGAVSVIYGGAGGLRVPGNQLRTQNSPGILDVSEANDAFGGALAAGDFDGDGYDDLAIGAAFEDVGAVVNAGVVHILYGSPSGLTAAGNQLWRQGAGGVGNTAEEGDKFGQTLATGDFNGDGYDDLLVGVPDEDFSSISGSTTNAGLVHVLFGSASGITATGSLLWSRQSAGHGAAEDDERFGWALAAGDFNGDGFDDFAVGIPFYDAGGVDDAGAALDFYGGSGGITPGTTLWSQATPNVAGVPGVDDNFGWALAAGDFDGDGRDDLAVGVPAEDLLGSANAGAVNVISRPLAATDTEGQFWYQGLNVELAVTPLDPVAPVVLARGEGVRFRVTLRRHPGSASGLDYWADAVRANGAETGPHLGPGTVQVPCCGTGSAVFHQRTAQSTPLGDYLYVVKVGHYPNEVLAIAVFTITVTAAEGAHGEPLAARAGGAASDAFVAEGDAAEWVVDGTAAEAAASAEGLPGAPALYAPYPNPTRGAATLGFSLPAAAPVRLAVYDALGREVAVLADAPREAGAHAVSFDGVALPAGVYLVRFEAGGVAQTQRLTLVR